MCPDLAQPPQNIYETLWSSRRLSDQIPERVRQGVNVDALEGNTTRRGQRGRAVGEQPSLQRQEDQHDATHIKPILNMYTFRVCLLKLREGGKVQLRCKYAVM